MTQIPKDAFSAIATSPTNGKADTTEIHRVAHELLMKKLSKSPRCKVQPNTGKGFAIIGAKTKA